MNDSRIGAILAFIIFGIISRFLPHPPNFTALNSIALFSACYLSSLSLSLTTVFAVMLLSDLALGFHPGIPFVYLSFGLIILMGRYLRSNQTLYRVPLFLSASSLLFFVVTSFGEWLTNPLYPKTGFGLGLCYLAGVPFLANQLLGDLTYGLLMFGCFSTLAEKTFLQRKSKLSTNPVF